MDAQLLINILFALVAFLGGIWVRGIVESLKELKATDSSLAAKVQNIEVLVVGQYVKRDDFDESVNKIFDKLDDILNKLDNKVSRAECQGKGCK